MPGDKTIEGVDQGREVKRSKHAAQRAQQAELGHERHATAVITADQRAVTPDQPPVLFPLLRRHGGQQARSFFVRRGKQRQFLPAIDGGDDPRRPTTKSSFAVVDKHRAPDLLCWGDLNVLFFIHE
jgi:hypothetical protein